MYNVLCKYNYFMFTYLDATQIRPNRDTIMTKSSV